MNVTVVQHSFADLAQSSTSFGRHDKTNDMKRKKISMVKDKRIALVAHDN
jgi:hypothetical protein